MIQIFVEADHLVRRPGDLYRVVQIHQIGGDYPVFPQDIVHHIKLINLVFQRQFVIRGLFLMQFLLQALIDFLLIIQIFFVDGAFHLPRFILPKPGDIYDAVVDHGIVQIIDGNFDIPVGDRRSLLGIDGFVGQNAGNSLLQNMIAYNLEIPVNGQVYIIARLRVLTFQDADHLAHVVHAHRLRSLDPLKGGFHGLLNTAFAHHIIAGIPFPGAAFLQIFGIELGQFLRVNLAGIAQDMGKIFAVIVSAYRIFFDGNPVQLIQVFHDHGHGLHTHILGHRSTDVFAEAGEMHGIADIHHLQKLFGSVSLSHQEFTLAVSLLRIFSKSESLAQIAEYLLGGSRPFFLFQLVDGGMPVDIRQKAQQSVSRHIVNVIAMFVQHDVEVGDDMVPVLLNHLNQLIDGGVQFPVLVGTVLIHILNFDGVSQFVVSQHIAVPIPDTASGTGNIPGFLRLQNKVVQIFLSMHDLQFKAAVNQRSPQQAENQGQERKPARKEINDVSLQLVKQISSLSFSQILPAGYLQTTPADIACK